MKNLKQIIFIMIITVITVITSKSINAQQTALPIAVFPAIQDLKIKPGDKARMQIQFKNGSELPLSGFVKVGDYTIRDTDGTPLLLDENMTNPKFGAAEWIKPSQNQITIPPNDFVTVDLAINVPAQISNCGHYAIVYFQPSENGTIAAQSGTTSATTIISKVGGLVNLQAETIDCHEGAQIVNFTMPTFVEHGPVQMSFNIYNQGDLDISPKGTISSTNITGKAVSKAIDTKRIFPETAKEYKLNFGEKWMMGRYKVNLSASYGSKNNMIEKVAYIWIIPWKEISVILLAIIIVALIVNRTMTSMKQKESHMKDQLEEEQSEIEKLKEQLRKRNE